MGHGASRYIAAVRRTAQDRGTAQSTAGQTCARASHWARSGFASEEITVCAAMALSLGTGAIAVLASCAHGPAAKSARDEGTPPLVVPTSAVPPAPPPDDPEKDWHT